jgi:hypothetical protein
MIMGYQCRPPMRVESGDKHNFTGFWTGGVIPPNPLDSLDESLIYAMQSLLCSLSVVGGGSE